MSFATALAAALRGVAKGLVDYRANKARPASPAMTGAQISAKLKQLQTSLPPFDPLDDRWTNPIDAKMRRACRRAHRLFALATLMA